MNRWGYSATAAYEDAMDFFDETGPAPFTLFEQIAEVKREIALREKLYPQWVTNGSLSQSKADRQLGTLRAALRTMQALIDDGR